MSTSSPVIADRLTVASVRLTRWLRAADREPSLSGPQASALAVIVHAGRIRMSDLARLEEVSRPTITRISGELLTLGLIGREADTEDGRVSWLTPTPSGRRRFNQGQARRIAPLSAAIDGLTLADRAALETGLAVMEKIVASGTTGR